MTITPRVFLDASVWIAAAGSSTGGSALILELCRHGNATAVCSRIVLLEAEQNIRNKLGENALIRFYNDIATLDLDLIEVLTEDELADYSKIIDPKDAHVLAAAAKAKAEVVLTLDRTHFFSARVREATLPFQVMTPGDFLRELVA